VTSVDQLIERLSETPEALRRATAEFDAGALRRSPATAAEGVETFSALGHLCHLRDIESDGYQVRIRRLRAERNPTLPSLSGERLAIERAYHLDDPGRALAAFEAARRQSIALLRSVATEEWGSRSGEFEGYGAVTLLRLVEIMVEHDAGHLQALHGLPRI
jgi:hypothetical protein